LKLPRWSSYNAVKYSPKRTIIKICPICGEQFPQKGKGNKKYCSFECAKKAKKQHTREIDQERIKNRDPLEHAAKMKDLYHTNQLRKNKTLNGTFTIPKTPLKESTTGGGNL